MTAAGARGPIEDALFLTFRLVRLRMLAGRRDWSNHQLYVMAAIAGGVLFWMIFFGTFVAVRALEAANAVGLISSIAAWAFLVYLFTDIFIAFGQALNDLYLSSDTQLLFAMPLRVQSIVTAKFVLGVLQNELYVGVFLLPFVFGYLLGVSAPWWAYPLAVAGVACFPAILYALLVVVTIAALRFIPARVAKEFLWLAGASIPTTFWVLSFARLVRVNGDVSSMQLPTPPAWLPSTWLGHEITALGLGFAGPALQWLLLLVVVTLVVGPIALAIVSGAFSAGYDATFVHARSGFDRSAKVRRGQRIAARTHPIAALLNKDFLVFARSPQLWFNHIAALGFVGYLLVGHKVQTPVLPLTLQLAMIQIGFVAALNSLNPGMIALSLEHGSIWVLKSTPLRERDILIAKIAGAYLQTAAISGVGAIALGVGYGFSFRQIAAIVAFALLIAAAAITRGVAFDTRFPIFNWENPNAINRGIRMVLPFFNSLGILLLCGLLLGFARMSFSGHAPGVLYGLVLTVLIVAFVVLQSVNRAMKNLNALEI